MQGDVINYQNLVHEYISNSLHTFSKTVHLQDCNVRNIIAVGNQLQTFVKYLVNAPDFGNLQPVDSKGNKKDSVSKRVQAKCGFKPYRSLTMTTQTGAKEQGTLTLLINPNKNIKLEFSHPETLIFV